MNIIIVGKRHGESRRYRLSTSTKVLLSFSFLTAPFALGWLGYTLAESTQDEIVVHSETAEAWEHQLGLQKEELEHIREQTHQELHALTLKLSEIQSQLLRVDAVGERLLESAGVQTDEFSFSYQPAVGGPNESQGAESTTNAALESYQVPEIRQALNQLAKRIDQREQQLEVLDDLMSSQKVESDTFVAGRPIKKGWMSSRYGKRTDPFSGRPAWHAGVDFAGKMGADIVAVASGIVTRADSHHGYGKMIEINHGNGYKTRYAHCKSLKASIGDVVRKGDVIALMGSTGRSTGPHVHFEVYKNGRTVDPAAYIYRKPR